MQLSIRPPKTITEYEAIEWLQGEIWGKLGIAPIHLLLTMAKESGVVLLALSHNKPVGFAYGFLAFNEKNQVKLASHQVGVLPIYHDQGLGYKIKLAQREACLARNIELITWTFDPLQGRNARFNLRKLGAVCNTYLPNLYGDMSDELNKGLPTDRFRVDWWLTDPWVIQRLEGPGVEPVVFASELVLNPATLLDNGIPIPSNTFKHPVADQCLVEIPIDITRLKQETPELALQWRLQTRDIFETVFKAGYLSVDLLHQNGRNYYFLTKKSSQT